MRGQRIELPGRIVVVNDCYNANPMSMRAALDDLAVSARRPPRRRARRHARARPRRARATTPRSASTRAPRGVELLVTVGPLARGDARRLRGESTPARPRRRPRSCASWCAAATRCWSRPRAASGSRSSPRRSRKPPAGWADVLIAGTAALLICIFLSPKFIEFLRKREFGQNIREEGPEGHHAKAGTPTMGGIIIFTAIAIPFLILSSYDWRSVGVFGAASRARCSASPTTTRRSSGAARWACAGARSCSSRSRSRSGCGGWPHQARPARPT